MTLALPRAFIKKSDVHSLHLYLVASQGFDLPHYFELMTVDDVPVFYYDSNMKGTIPVPEWLNNTMGQQYWDFLVDTAEIDQDQIVKGLKSATQQFNVTGASIYQAYGGCDLHPDGTAQAFLTHAFNGKDFVSLDIETRTFIAAVPQAVLYKRLRERDQTNLELLDYFYRTNCVEGIKEFLRHAPSLRMKRVPEVRLFEKKNSFTEITCHVTGFYPQTVQVQWFGSDMQPVVERIIEGEVLPNGDGSYQTRKSVVIPAEHTDIHHYSCVVQHSSISGNITKAWDVHSFSGIMVASHGFDLPEYFQVFSVDDVPVLYYDSNMKSPPPVPEWMTSTAARQMWSYYAHRAIVNKRVITAGLMSAREQFNLTGASTNIYQSQTRCDLHPNGTVRAFLTHAFNGKDFVSFDMKTKTFTATVPQAVFYKRKREENQADLEIVANFYRTWGIEGLKMFLQHNPRLQMKKVSEVRIFEKKNSAFTEITCHVTGFYPRTVQVQWFESDMQPVVEGVIEGEVLPNGDGTYQIRKSVVIPAEHTDIHHYSCVVQHSSMPGNITKTWGKIVLSRDE
ncbi:IgG receptor FcRn large subunit p51-like [Chanos chanos]|uniref:IgG receptor FcRn large subunit p51-like n=1 Tax=Chanos chanos TaxID=29144 RepID=A0A6J2WNP7_CHACN|nr:IgG receptor FcRn large subunit p51-like [Chanos chanos]